MGRGRGKGKKLTPVTNHEEPGSGGEESLPAYKRRGRPQKPMKDEPDIEEDEEIKEEDGDSVKAAALTKEMRVPTTGTENGKKRKNSQQTKEKLDSAEEENGVGTRSITDVSTKTNGFRQNGSRRKSKPRRAAEAGVECK